MYCSIQGEEQMKCLLRNYAMKFQATKIMNVQTTKFSVLQNNKVKP